MKHVTATITRMIKPDGPRARITIDHGLHQYTHRWVSRSLYVSDAAYEAEIARVKRELEQRS